MRILFIITLLLHLSFPAAAVEPNGEPALQSACSDQVRVVADWLSFLESNQDPTGLRTESLRLIHSPMGVGSDEVATYFQAVSAQQLGEHQRAIVLVSGRTRGLEPWGSLFRLERARIWAADDPLVGLRLFSSLEHDGVPAHWQPYVRLSRLHMAVRGGAMDDAHTLISTMPATATHQLRQDLESTRWRKPWLGGALSAVLPGAGQAYAGRWGEGLSALLVNGVFGWALWHNIRKDNESAAVVIGLFAVGFYGGNVYGGADAAVRRNRSNRDRLVTIVERDFPLPPRPRPCTF